MSEPPSGFLDLGTTEVGHEAARSALLTARVAGALGGLGLVLSVVALPALALALLAFLVATFAWQRARHLRNIPFAINANHPWVLDTPMGTAEVAIRTSDERWIVLGDVRLKLHTDPLLGDPLVVEQEEPWATVARWPKAPSERLQRWLTVGNTALALRDAVNGHDEDAEEQRRRAAADTDLLDREWPEEEDAIDEGLALSRWLDAARTEK